MANASISGLASGLDTATIINQLMQLEALPQTKLKSRVTFEQSAITVLQGLNSKLASLATKAKDLTSGTVWGTLKATSSDAAVAVSATSSASPSSFTVEIISTAASHQLGFATSSPLTGSQVTGATPNVVLTASDGTAHALDTGDGSLKGLVDAINASTGDTGVRASAVKGADGYRLLVESTDTGAGRSFSLTAEDGTDLLGGPTVRAGRDAVVSLGAVTTSSSTNTFTDVVPGVTLTLAASAKTGSVSEVSVARDATTRSDSVKSLVDAVNGVLTDIATHTKYDAATKTAGKLSGDSGVRAAGRALAEAIYPTDGTSLGQYGLEVDRYGKVTFNTEKFAAAYAADPAAVTEAFTGADGFAARVQKVAEAASDKYDGSITAAIEGRTKGISRLQSNIDAWDTRLEMRRSTLERTYTALETALSRMNSQGNWLAGQISGLPKYSD